MRVTLLVLCYFLFTISSLGQTISGKVIDSKSDQPISFVNIGIIGKNIGTVSDTNGNFQLSVSNGLDNDTLKFSIVSYKSVAYNLGDIRKSPLSNIIEMDERIINLEEVIILDRGNNPIEMGIKKRDCYPIPLYKKAKSDIPFPQKGYRHEIGTLFLNDKSLILDSVQLNISICEPDTLELRLNVYSFEDKKIKNMLSQPIYLSIEKERALNSPTIRLEHLQLEINADFLITIENYKRIEDNSIRILANLKSKGKDYPTYYRSNTQSNWTVLKNKSHDFGLSIMAFAH